VSRVVENRLVPFRVKYQFAFGRQDSRVSLQQYPLDEVTEIFGWQYLIAVNQLFEIVAGARRRVDQIVHVLSAYQVQVSLQQRVLVVDFGRRLWYGDQTAQIRLVRARHHQAVQQPVGQKHLKCARFWGDLDWSADERAVSVEQNEQWTPLDRSRRSLQC